MSNISHLPFQFIQQIDIHRLKIPVYHHDNRQAHRHFCRCHHHHEKHEQLPRRVATVSGKCHEQKVHGIQHDFNAHQQHNCVALQQYARDANRKERKAQVDVPVERNGL